jgi:hypothetical protein
MKRGGRFSCLGEVLVGIRWFDIRKWKGSASHLSVKSGTARSGEAVEGRELSCIAISANPYIFGFC